MSNSALYFLTNLKIIFIDSKNFSYIISACDFLSINRSETGDINDEV